MEQERLDIGIYQIADDLYTHRAYRIDGPAAVQQTSAR